VAKGKEKLWDQVGATEPLGHIEFCGTGSV